MRQTVDAREFARVASARVSTSDTKERRNRRAPEWVRETRAPVPLPPPKSCDCQFHIFGDAAKYPLRFDVTFQPPKATFADMRQVLRTMGFERGVIVHTQRYDIDHSLLIDEARGVAPAGAQEFPRHRHRAPMTLSDREIGAPTCRSGVRGGPLPSRQALGPGARIPRRCGARCCAFTSWAGTRACTSAAPTSPTGANFLRTHGQKASRWSSTTWGHLDFSLGLEAAGLALDFRSPARKETWWLKLSNGNRDSVMESGWDDAIPFGKVMIAAAPDRNHRGNIDTGRTPGGASSA